jgi:hypothetical protein
MAGALVALCTLRGVPVAAQSPNDLAGTWALNRQLSQFPQEVGFSAAIPGLGPGATGGGRGGRRDGGGGLERLPERPTQTQEDARRVRLLTDEVRLPPERLTIAVTPATLTITPDRGEARSLQPGRRDETVTLGTVAVVTTAAWVADHWTIVYIAETGRLLRYSYTTSQNPRQLAVDVEFVERGKTGDRVRRIYEPAAPGDPAAGQSSSSAGPPAGRAPLLLPPGAGGIGSRQASPVATPAAAAAIDQRLDAPLKGLTRLGIVFEGIGTDAAKCGLKEDVLEAAVTKHLTDAGFRVLRNTDDDTYLYVNINTATASAGLCVSRYDVTLYSHTAAPLAHTSSPVELQVELLHKGGLAGGGPAAHADAVTKNVLEYVDQFATRVRDANK